MTPTSKLPPLEAVMPNAPLRLDVAAALAFPDGSMTASGLRREAAKGRLAIEQIAGKDYTTLGAISEMRALCRNEAKARASGSNPPAATPMEICAQPSGSSATGAPNAALVLARAKLARLKLPSQNYILSKAAAPRERGRDPAQVKVADVVSIYADDVLARHARPRETAVRLDRILDFFGAMTFAELNRSSCAAYVARRGHIQAARRELEDLRAAVFHHYREGLCTSPAPVVLPPRALPRASAGSPATRPRACCGPPGGFDRSSSARRRRATARHIARFILVALYTGTRSAAICGAALKPTEGRGFVDVEQGVFYRRRARQAADIE
jgi:hypothetical protein